MQVSHSRAHLAVSRFLWSSSSSSSSSSAAPKRSLIARAPFASSAGIPTPMASLTTAPETKPKRHQNVLVMRHGDRMDNFVESWLREAARPWDPPLYEAGRERASRTGMELRTQLGFPIDRVVVSPFVRCVETASEVVSALSAAGERASAARRAALPIDPPAIKTCVEYGLCEMFNGVAIRHPAKDGRWGFNLSEIKLKLPKGTVDTEYAPVAHELPNWGETSEDARARYERVIRALADKYPYENLLLITHGEGLRAAVSTFLNGTKIRKVDYCAYVRLRRGITPNGENSFSAGEFGDVSHHGYLLKDGDA